MGLDDLNVHSIGNNFTFSFELGIISLEILGETEFFTENDGLSAGELELGSSEGFKGMLNVGISDSDGEEDGTDIYSCGSAEGLSESTSHSLLESICTST